MKTYTNNPRINEVLDGIFRLDEAQRSVMADFFEKRHAQEPDFNIFDVDQRTTAFLADKAMVLDADKARLCAMLCRSMQARRIIEAGTAYGASTLFLAAALKDTLGNNGGTGAIYCSEWEPEKAAVARENFEKAGVDDVIDLREGDILKTLRDIEGPIDLILMDIWKPVPLVLIKMLKNRLRPGCAILADNATSAHELYGGYLEYVRDPINGFSSLTLPFEGGLELTIKL